MAANDTTKEAQENAVVPQKEVIMHVKDENARVSLEYALEKLKQAQELLASYHDVNCEWQEDPSQLLNTTAAALDEAALALKKVCDEKDDNDNNSYSLKQQQQQVQQYSQQVIEGRRAILDATQQVVCGNRPAQLWNPNTLIVYATHTGTSRDYALDLASHLLGKKHNNDTTRTTTCDVQNIKEVSLLDLQERSRVYFICSTFGLGRPPRDAEVVYTTLQLLDSDGKENNDYYLVAAPETQALQGLEVAVAALGNSDFGATFCKFGNDLSKRLCALGASEILPVTTLDSKHGKASQQQQFNEWKQRVFDVEGIAKDDGIAKETVESKCACVIL